MLIRYRPVLLEGQRAANTFRAMPASDPQPGETPTVGKALLDGGAIEATARRNAGFLGQALADLAEARAAGRKRRLIVPLNSLGLVGTDAAARITAAARQADPSARAAAIIELFGFPRLVTLDSLDDTTIPLLPFFDKFLAAPHPECTDFTAFASCNFFGISLDLESPEMAGCDGDALLGDWWAAAAKRRLKLFVAGVASGEMLDRARRLGAMGIDGPANGDAIEWL